MKTTIPTTSSDLPGAVHASQAIVTKDRVYLLGGIISGAPSSTVYTAPILADGTLGTWTTTTSLPGIVYLSQAIVTKDRVYLLGGFINDAPSSTVYTTPILADGTLGTWTTATSLPGAVAYSHAIVTNARVYLLGGYINGAHSSTVYTAPISADGTLGAWTTATSLPGTVAYSQAIVTKDRVYLLGGVINGAYSSTVYTAPILADGTLGTWTTATSLPGTVYFSQAVIMNDRAYLLGGMINGAPSSVVYSAPIDADGSLGEWGVDTALQVIITNTQAIVTKDRVYLLGGCVNRNTSSAVYTVPINAGEAQGSRTSVTPKTTEAKTPAEMSKKLLYLQAELEALKARHKLNLKKQRSQKASLKEITQIVERLTAVVEGHTDTVGRLITIVEQLSDVYPSTH